MPNKMDMRRGGSLIEFSIPIVLFLCIVTFYPLYLHFFFTKGHGQNPAGPLNLAAQALVGLNSPDLTSGQPVWRLAAKSGQCGPTAVASAIGVGVGFFNFFKK